MKLPGDCITIDEVRIEIDRIDEKIIELLGKRFLYVKEIVKFKNKDKESIVSKDRRDEVLQTRRRLAEQYGLDPDIIEKMYKDLIEYFINRQIEIAKETGE
ncbi:MAG: chorismate mutase [Bacteroidales bacterium]|nr:chorismate mutase [Bacteroidales bacterium]